MNILLIIGLVLFAFIITWVYVLFMMNTINPQEKVVHQEPIVENALERCHQLFNEGLHSELQRFAQRELAKNYGNVELRRILAQSLMATGNTEIAIMHFEAILSINPNDVETEEILANYYMENGPKSRAIDIYNKILSYDNGNIDAVEKLAKLYEEIQNYPKAIEMNKLLVDIEVDSDKILEYRYLLADLYIKTNDIQKAFEEYESIHKENPDNIEITMLLADLAYQNRYWQDCLGYYQQIIATVGEDYEILQKIAQIYAIVEDWENAAKTYQKLIEIEGQNSPNYLYHQNELANALLKSGETDEAINLLKDMLLQYPTETSFMFTLAQAYTVVGEYQTGMDLYNKLLDTLPSEQSGMIIKYLSNLISTWAMDLFNRGEYNKSFDKFFDALKLDEENDEVYYQLGVCNYRIKSYQDAIAHFKRAISIKPQNSSYYFGLGCAYDEIGTVKNAKAAFQDALNIDPDNIKARIAYAIMLTKELEYAQSIEQFNKVLKYIPDNADTLYNIALAYEMVGDFERAIKYYKKAIDAEPDHKEANNNLSLLIDEPYTPKPKEEVAQIQQEPVEQASENPNSDIDLKDFEQYM